MKPEAAFSQPDRSRQSFSWWIQWVSGTVLVLCLGAFLIVSWRIGTDVTATARDARQYHPGDDVHALIQYVADPTHTLQGRNRAVWALGQLGDPRALPHLRQYYTGQPCDHQNAICQRELGKAIHLLEGGVNATALVWRH